MDVTLVRIFQATQHIPILIEMHSSLCTVDLGTFLPFSGHATCTTRVRQFRIATFHGSTLVCQYCRRGTPPIILINSVKTQLEAIHLHVSDHHSCKNNALEVAIHTDKQTKRHATQVYLVSCVECYCIYKESVQHSDSSRCQVLDPPFTIGLHPEHGLGVLGS